VSDVLTAGSSTELSTLVGLLWGGPHQDAVRVVTGAPPRGYRVIEQFVAVPSLRAARMLLPGSDRRVRAAALWHYNRLRAPATRAARAALAALARTGLDARLGSTVSVCLPASVGRSQEPDLVVTAMLAQRLGRGPLHAAIGVGSAGPNSKPTLQLFDATGAPVAFVKVGWNTLTRALVTAEAQALQSIGDDALPGIHRPRLLLHEQWHDLTLLASVPMPLTVRPLRRDSPPEPRVHSALPRVTGQLATTAYWDALRQRWRDLRDLSGTTVRDREAVDAYLGAVERRCGQAEVEIGAWHGDWVSWNMAVDGDDLWVWDWEHYAPLAPVGFDGAHFRFQHAFLVQRQPVDAALEVVSAPADDAPTQARVVAAAYPLEIVLRAARMHAQGAGWNPRFHDGAMDWLQSSAQR